MTHIDDHLPHLDGIRAVALLGVLLFHFQVPYFQGGFAGVDVFLPLSGFLITRNIAHKLHERRFCLREFYQRRIFRLLPAATVVIFLSACTAVLILPTKLARSAVSSARAALLFHANVFFHRQSGYFDDSPQLKPLLHMWSLSLEEQFYFLWAPLLSLLARIPHRELAMPIATAGMLTASLATAVCMNDRFPSFVFFELPPRIFQFAAGAFLSFFFPISAGIAEQPYSLPRLLKILHLQIVVDLVSISALLTLIMSYVLLPKNASALQMVPTTVATCMLVASRTSRLARHLLSNPFLRHIGHLSYSAYLVHWPLFVFTRFLTQAIVRHDPPIWLMFMLTYLCGMALRWIVEDRVRQSRSVYLRAVFAAMFLAAVLATFWLCESEQIMKLNEGITSRLILASKMI